MTDPKPVLPGRLSSMDAYRGLVLALMMGEALHFCAVSAAKPASAVWSFLCFHQSHVPWIGGSMHLLDRTFPTEFCGICLMDPVQPALNVSPEDQFFCGSGQGSDHSHQAEASRKGAEMKVQACEKSKCSTKQHSGPGEQ